MADPDQFIKDMFLEQTAEVTANRVRFEVPAEVTARALTPDGILTRADPAIDLSTLPPPLCTLRHEAVLDFKTPGDHTDRRALARAKLRRDLRWVTLLEAVKPDAAAALDPRDHATWVVAPNFPKWIDNDKERGLLTADELGDGCKRLGTLDHDILWIAANELPLRVALLPFLFMRSGGALLKLLEWLTTVKDAAWVMKVVHSMPMEPEVYEQVNVPRDPAEQRIIRLRLFHALGAQLPEGTAEYELRPLRHQFERRLKRPLSPPEDAVLKLRVATLGTDRLGDVVLDLDPAALAAWLADPAAC